MANAKFWDRIAPKYAKQDIADPQAYEATLQRTAAHLQKTDTLLEIGCGTGDTAHWLSDHCGQTFATDVSTAMLDVARERAAAHKGNPVQFDIAAAETIHSNAPFDVICAFNILHLVDDLPHTLRAIHGQLVPGGKLISKTPCVGNLSVFIRVMIKAMQLIGKAPAIQAVSDDDLCNQITAAGFRIVEVEELHAKTGRPFIVAERQ